jgi:phosphatidylglycerol:prolipoprotein diacylglycerol transferase
VWPVILQIGPFTIYSFGLMVAIACMAGAWVIGREMGRHGIDPEIAWSIAVWSTFIGFASSAIWYYVQHHFWELLHSPLATLASSFGAIAAQLGSGEGSFVGRLFGVLRGLGSGFVWYGGLIGGALTTTWIIHKHRLPWLITVDCVAPALALAYGIGRIGCQLAGDGDWGTVTDLPWGMSYPRAIVGWPPLDERGVPYPDDVRVHPAPVYDMLLSFGIFAFLTRMARRPHAPGTILWWYLVLAGASRLLIEFWRTNPRVMLGLTAAQLFSVIIIAIGLWRLLAARHAAPVVPHPAGAVQPARR